MAKVLGVDYGERRTGVAISDDSRTIAFPRETLDCPRAEQAAAAVARLACERARQRGSADEWLKPTLLGLAFAEHNHPLSRALTREVEREGADAWKLDSTLSDLHRHVAQMKDTAMQAEFTALIARLEAI